MPKVVLENSDLYAPLIQSMFELDFPGSQPRGSEAVFEAVVKELIGTKQCRLGPVPSVEAQAAIRESVRWAMARELPVPILTPWGASKQGPWEVDVAEMMALRQLGCLSDRVRAHYEPGISVRIRLEDLTDDMMFEDVPGWRSKTSQYVATFTSLARILAFPGLAVLPESSLISGHEQYKNAGRRNAEILSRILTLTQPDRAAALRCELPDWSGPLDDEHLAFYRRAYDAFYPGESDQQKTKRLATYFGNALARFQYAATGGYNWLGHDSHVPYVTLSLTGIPWAKKSARILYRTIPQHYTNQHRAPWIGKGYVRVVGRDATPAISGWNGDSLEFEKNYAVVARDGETVRLQCDYVALD